ncbi:homeobox protein 13 isoform X2 [Toxorhynchites rutilus septentrionalis]|uniref:homeobox protein 13 isoform X2 n=1 Tax=Toxorhynchites rutilus septentrionalis TaxID=329112 RepID=UPI00247934AB|nr:homeobox protein 13 isoform X2 [Toxorhynchites rutilus septentrionalis]
MNRLRVFNFMLFAFCFLCTIRQLESTCVLDSDFGFILNCAFKKSGLFRVRNLGGVKAHFGLGFSVGDELGLAESLGNVEGSKRRALNIRTNVNNIGVLPASKMPASYPPPIQQSRPQALTARPVLKLATNNPIQNLQKPTQGTPAYVSPATNLMTKATSLPLGVPAFKPLPKHEPEPNQLMNQTSSFHNPPAPNQQIIYKDASIQKVPAFQAMPQSVSRISTGPVIHVDNKLSNPTIKNSIMTIPPRHDVIGKGATVVDGVDLMGHTVEELATAANVSVEVIREAIRVRKQEILAQQQYHKQQAAIIQAQILAAQQATSTTTSTTTTSTTTTTTPRPRRYPTHSGHKVMNAPKEYYPVGYDKNFDDNFSSKVDLPYTTFNCGEQKHFPGLYGDEDLGCMVFHVCALTDDGLIMKSFLCPESTLFDQTILKCNWWFYVDCKNSKSLYDSNLPVSKSYQLMKALSFFSTNYKNPQNLDEGVDVEALKNSVTLNSSSNNNNNNNNNNNSNLVPTGARSSSSRGVEINGKPPSSESAEPSLAKPKA